MLPFTCDLQLHLRLHLFPETRVTLMNVHSTRNIVKFITEPRTHRFNDNNFSEHFFFAPWFHFHEIAFHLFVFLFSHDALKRKTLEMAFIRIMPRGPRQRYKKRQCHRRLSQINALGNERELSNLAE